MVLVSGILGVMDGFRLMVPTGRSASKKAICWSVGVAASDRSDDGNPLLPLLLDATDSLRHRSTLLVVGGDAPRSLAVIVTPESESWLPLRWPSGRPSPCPSGLGGPEDPFSGLTAARVFAIEQMEKLRACARVSRSSSTMSRIRLS